MFRKLKSRLRRASFSRIYRNREWGGELAKGMPFCSGEGSHSPTIVAPYVTTLRKHLLSLDSSSRTLVDLGCGDFAVGKQIADCSDRYVGVDIVPDLINFNQEKFGTDKIHFKCCDIVSDPLPEGDIVTVRQVLQHLSNSEIAHIIKKLQSFKYVFLTEDWPKGDFAPNLDSHNRTKVRSNLSNPSAVVLSAPPFNVPEQRMERLMSIEHDHGILVTHLITWSKDTDD